MLASRKQVLQRANLFNNKSAQFCGMVQYKHNGNNNVLRIQSPCRTFFHAPSKINFYKVDFEDIQPAGRQPIEPPKFDRQGPIGAIVGPGAISVEEEANLMARASILKDHLEQEDVSTKERLEANEELFEIYNKLVQAYKATEYLKEALELKKETYGPVSEQVLQTLRRLRDTLNAQKRFQEAINYQFQVISLMAKLVNFRTDNTAVDEEAVKSSQKFAPEWFIVGDLYFKLAQYTQARDAFKRCSSIYSKFFTKHDMLTRCNVRLGFVHYKLGQYKESVEVLEKEVNKPGEMEKVFQDSLELSDLYLNLGNACMYLNNPQKSEAYYKKAIETIKGAWQSNKDSNSTKLAELLYSLAVSYTAQKEQHVLASSIIDDALQIFNHELTKIQQKQQYSPEEDSLRQSICECFMMRGMILHTAGNHAEAQDFYKKALQIVEPLTERYKNVDSDLPVNYCRDVGFVHIRLGEILNATSAAESVELYKKAIEIMQRCQDPKQVRHLLAECHKEYGTHLFKTKDFEKAKEQLQKSYSMFSDMAVLDFDPDLGHISRMLGDILAPKNDLKKAMAFYDEAAGLLMLQEGNQEENVKSCLELMKKTGEVWAKQIEEKQKQIDALEAGRVKDGAARIVLRRDKLSGMKMNVAAERRFLNTATEDAKTKEKILEYKKMPQQQTAETVVKQ